jgi:hypothetical protein
LQVEEGDFDYALTDAQLMGSGTDTLARIESAELTGGASGNTLNALGFTQGPVELNGMEGNDTLIGTGRQNDNLSGGAGDDLFVLGDGLGVFYDNGVPFFEGNGHAVITDFSKADDHIQLTGSAADYLLKVDDPDTGSTGIFRSELGGLSDDLICVVQGVVGLDLNDLGYFTYV